MPSPSQTVAGRSADGAEMEPGRAEDCSSVLRHMLNDVLMSSDSSGTVLAFRNVGRRSETQARRSEDGAETVVRRARDARTVNEAAIGSHKDHS